MITTDKTSLTGGSGYEFSIYYKPQQYLNSSGQPWSWSYGTFKIYAEVLNGASQWTDFTSNVINASNSNNWTQLSVRFTMPIDATSIRLFIVANGSWFPVLLDNAKFVEVQYPEPNQNGFLLNSDMESYFNNKFTGWENWASNGDDNSFSEKYVKRVPNAGRSGNCAFLSSKGEGSYTLGYLANNLVGGNNYDFSVWYKPQQYLTSGVPATWSYGTFKIYVEVMNGASKWTSFTSNVINASNSNNWSQLSLNFTMPSDATQVKISLWNQGAWFPVLIDDALLINIGNYKANNFIISNIQPNSNLTVQNVLSNIDLGQNISYTVETSGGNNIAGTGTKIKISNGTTYTIIIYGDVNGDGKITISDIIAVKKHLLNINALSGNFLIAGKINKQAGISIEDLAAIKMDLLKVTSIPQA